MFDQDYFQDDIQTEPSMAGKVVGSLGMWGLHFAKVAFLVYSGYHGISATAQYGGDSQLAVGARIVGIIVNEIVLFSLYISWHNQKITGAAQSIAAGITYIIGFVIACLGIVADSQMHAGYTISAWLDSYIYWVLPATPAIMAFGALLVHELEPHQLQKRRASAEHLSFEDDNFMALMASLRADMNAAKTIKNMQLNARMSAAKQIAAWYGSDEAQKAITSTAMQNAPALLRAIGVDFGDVDTNRDGQISREELQGFFADNPGLAQQLALLARQPEPQPSQPRRQPITEPMIITAAAQTNPAEAHLEKADKKEYASPNFTNGNGKQM